MQEAVELIDAMKKFARTTWGDSGDDELDAGWNLVHTARSLLLRLGENYPELLGDVADYDTYAESEAEKEAEKDSEQEWRRSDARISATNPASRSVSADNL